MARRYLLAVSVVIATLFSVYTPSSEAAPAFRFKKIYNTFEPSRSERRLMISGPSPVHFIQPFVGLPHYFGGSPSSSSVYKLPLRLFSNAKPYAVFRGLPRPQNVVRLPLQYISNAKPIGVYFKDPSSFNYL